MKHPFSLSFTKAGSETLRVKHLVLVKQPVEDAAGIQTMAPWIMGKAPSALL